MSIAIVFIYMAIAGLVLYVWVMGRAMASLDAEVGDCYT